MIHLVYPHRDRISTPDVIGWTLAQKLSQRFAVKTHDLDALYRIEPEPGDVLIGHAHPFPGTVFRRSLDAPNWSRRILLQPFNGNWDQVGFLDDIIDRCDQFLAITGPYWFGVIGQTHAARWRPKMLQLDLAIDREQFPLLRQTVRPAGHRKVLYIGNDHPGKNLPYLDAVARTWSGTIDWVGRGRPLETLKPKGFVDFSSAEGRALLDQYDMLITLGSADANPTTVLEALAWGMIPICTPTSGYVGEDVVVNVPGDDVAAVCQKLDELQAAPDTEILARRKAGLRRLDAHYNWQRFVAQVEAAILSDHSPPLAPSRRAAPSYRAQPKLALRVLAKNMGYAIERRWPAFTLSGRTAMWVRNLLKI